LVGKLLTNETQITSKRLTLVNKDNYVVDLEYNEDFVILHLPLVTKMTKDTYLDMRDSFEKFVDFVATIGHDYIWVAISPEDNLTAKLITKLGFNYEIDSEGLAVYRKETR
jgi:hypothetical protein